MAACSKLIPSANKNQICLDQLKLFFKNNTLVSQLKWKFPTRIYGKVNKYLKNVLGHQCILKFSFDYARFMICVTERTGK